MDKNDRYKIIFLIMFGYFLFQVSEIAELLMMNVQALGGIRADLKSIEIDISTLYSKLDTINSTIRYYR